MENDIYVFVANAKGNSVSRLGFGNSILNTPVSAAFRLKNTMPWDVQILESCQEKSLLVIDAQNGDLIRMNLGNEISNSLVSISTYQEVGEFDFPHSISRIFMEGEDLHFFIPDANYHSLTRLEFKGEKKNTTINSENL